MLKLSFHALADSHGDAPLDYESDLWRGFDQAEGWKRRSPRNSRLASCNVRKENFNRTPRDVNEVLWAPRGNTMYYNMLNDSLRAFHAQDAEALGRLRQFSRIDHGAGGLATTRPSVEFNFGKEFRLIDNESCADIHGFTEMQPPCFLPLSPAPQTKNSTTTATTTTTTKSAVDNQGLDLMCPLFEIIGVSVGTAMLDGMRIVDLWGGPGCPRGRLLPVGKGQLREVPDARKPLRQRDCLLHRRRRNRSHSLAIGANRKRWSKSMIGRPTLKMITPAKATGEGGGAQSQGRGDREPGRASAYDLQWIVCILRAA